MMEKKYYGMLDICKFGCALIILFYHYFSEHSELPGILNEALSLYAVAVALFMTISGFLVFSKIEMCETRRQRWDVVIKQVKRILQIYLLWSIPYLVFQVARWNYSTISLGFVLDTIQGWVFGSTFYTIWFMPALCIGLLLAFCASEYLPKVVMYMAAVAAYILAVLIGTYQFFGDTLPGISALNLFAGEWLGGCRGGIFFGFPLIIIGRFISKRQDKCKHIPLFILSVVFMGLLIAEALLIRYIAHQHTGIDTTIFMVPLVGCILGFLVSVPAKNNKEHIWMRQMSTLLFMSQRLFLTVLPEITVGWIYWNFQCVSFWLICGGTFCFSALLLLVSKRICLLRKLY